MVVIIFLFSGCRVRVGVGEYKISGRVTEADGETGIQGVKINYKINNYSWRSTSTYNQAGNWYIRANKGDRVTIWAQKDFYSFQPAPCQITVSGDRNDVNFIVSGWYDDFSNTDNRWAQDDRCGYGYNEYWIMAEPNSSTRVMAPKPVPPSNIIEARISSNDEKGGYGFVFNFSGENIGDYFHIFRVKPYGDSDYGPYFELIKATIRGKTSEGLKLEYDVITKQEGNIHGYENRLKVKQNWREVWLFINDDRVWTGEIDAELVESLDFGLYAFADDSDEYIAWFNDLQVDGIVNTQGQISLMAFEELKAFKDIEYHK